MRRQLYGAEAWRFGSTEIHRLIPVRDFNGRRSCRQSGQRGEQHQYASGCPIVRDGDGMCLRARGYTIISN